MRSSIDYSFSLDAVQSEAPDAGFFTWDIPDNVLYADAALAALFGIEAAKAEQGLPVESYLERVHPEDLPGVAKAIHDSIVAHIPQQETYRVRNAAGQYVRVASFGKGFRDQDGCPIRYVGIVIPSTDVGDVDPTAH